MFSDVTSPDASATASDAPSRGPVPVMGAEAASEMPVPPKRMPCPPEIAGLLPSCLAAPSLKSANFFRSRIDIPYIITKKAMSRVIMSA